MSTFTVDTTELRDRVREMYRAVAREPGGDYHFETGSALSRTMSPISAAVSFVASTFSTTVGPSPKGTGVALPPLDAGAGFEPVGGVAGAVVVGDVGGGVEEGRLDDASGEVDGVGGGLFVRVHFTGGHLPPPLV